MLENGKVREMSVRKCWNHGSAHCTIKDSNIRIPPYFRPQLISFSCFSLRLSQINHQNYLIFNDEHTLLRKGMSNV